MKKLKSLFCFAVAALLTGTTAISNSNNNKNIMNQNVEKIEEVQREGERLFTIHYYRDDNYYDDWDLWFWKDGGSGSAVKFTNKEDYGVNAQIDLNSDEYVGSTKFYFIVRRGDWEKKDATDKDRELEIDESMTDIYLYNDFDGYYTTIDNPIHKEHIARYNVSQEQTKAQLKYSFTTDGTTYNFETMKINFGAIIHKDVFDQIKILNNGAGLKIKEVGIAIAKHSSLESKGIVNIVRAFKDSRDDVMKVVCSYYSGEDGDGLSSMQMTDENGTAKEGNYYIFTANLDYSNYVNDVNILNETIDAVAYIKYSDYRYSFLQIKSCSIISLAKAYTDSESFSSFNEYVQGSLTALATLNNN